MSFIFNTDNFPLVKVIFNGQIKTDEEFNRFTDLWESLYDKKTPFTMVFDTKKMKIPKLKYSIKLSDFIKKKLKKKNPQYLQKSYIIIKKRIVIFLLDFIFIIQPPVAPVYLTKKYFDDESRINIIKRYKPRKHRNI